MELRVTDLAVARGGLVVLSGLSFTLGAKQAIVLRGPNGIGKTTVLRTVAGLQPPVSGEIRASEEAIAYAAHADGLKAMLSVAENLQFWADVYGSSTIDAALKRMNLTELRNRPAANLSAGQKRRLGLARLLVAGRPVWVMDEPTVSLDTASVAVFAEVVGAHLAAGGAALMATHIDLGLPQAQMLDLTPFAANTKARRGEFDAGFGSGNAGDFA